MMLLCDINWDAVSSITGIVMMAVALFTLWISYRQRRDDQRARLAFEIISWQGKYLLKITNVGKETAYNIKLKFGGSFLENHYSEDIKAIFRTFSVKQFCLVGGRSVYYYLTPEFTEERKLNIFINERFLSDQTNQWYSENADSQIRIRGKYNNRYKVKELFAISDFFLGLSQRVTSPEATALEEISNGLACKNASSAPIQEQLAYISKSLNELTDVIRAKD